MLSKMVMESKWDQREGAMLFMRTRCDRESSPTIATSPFQFLRHSNVSGSAALELETHKATLMFR